MVHPLHSYMVIGTLCILGLVLFIQGYRLSLQGQKFLGSSPISKPGFLLGKVSLFSSWALLLVKAILPGVAWFTVFPPMPWLSMALLLPGTIITAISFIHLGASLKVGLPEQETALKTRGLYSISRNPLYLGVYLITVASVLYFPDVVNIVLAITGILMHHMITLGEEKFLSSRFGSSYEEYKKKVRRYL